MISTLIAAVALLASVASADDTWLEPSGARLEIVSGALVRRRGPETATLHSIDPSALGTVLDISGDREGTVFVVSDRGLWIGWDEMEVLDRVEPIEAAPRGSPTSVFVDAERRVWLATDAAIGVLDPVYFFGRTLDDVAEPCGAGPYHVRGSASGKPLFRGSRGEIEHDPGAGDLPAVTSLHCGDRELQREGIVASSYPRALEIVARGTARGGATFRYRLDHHHVWLPFEDVLTLERTPPGNHRLEIVAMDSSLRRSEPFVVQLAIDLPLYYQRRFVVAAVLLATIGIAAFFFHRYRDRSVGSRWARTALSSAVTAVILLQLLAGVAGHAAGWPFMGYTMYTTSYPEGACTYEMTLVGIGPSGSRRYIPYQSLGVAGDEPSAVYHALIDGGSSAARDYVSRWNARTPGDPLQGVAVHSRRVRLTAGGPVRVAPLVHCSWRDGAK